MPPPVTESLVKLPSPHSLRLGVEKERELPHHARDAEAKNRHMLFESLKALERRLVSLEARVTDLGSPLARRRVWRSSTVRRIPLSKPGSKSF